MNTQTNHGAAIPLPAKPEEWAERVKRSLRQYRDQVGWGAHIYCLWSKDVEQAVIDEERQRFHREANPIDLEKDGDVAVKARGVTFVMHHSLPPGTVALSLDDPLPQLERYS